MMPFSDKRVTIALYLLGLFVNFTIIGLILNGYSASQFVLTGTAVIICYIIRAGTGAAALASVWVIGLISVATMRHLWFHDIPRPEFRIIPFALLVSWLFALASVWLLGKVSDYLRQYTKSIKWLFSLLIGFVFLFLSIGWGFYDQVVYIFL